MYYFLRWQRLCQHMIHKKLEQSKLVRFFEKTLKSQPLNKNAYLKYRLEQLN